MITQSLHISRFDLLALYSIIPNDNPRDSNIRVAIVTILLVITFLVCTFALLRHGGRYGELDSANFTRHINDVLDSGHLVPGPDNAYQNGYGFSALGTYLVEVGGLKLSHLQRYGSALLAVWIILPAWLVFRELTQSNQAALLASLILFFQPDFLFPILRGTHEKFTRGLMFCVLYLLIRSIRSRSNFRLFTAFVFTFYIVAFAMITFNNMLSSSFIIALALALILSWLAIRLSTHSTSSDHTTLHRLFLILTSLIGLSFLFIIYLYPPARHDIKLLNTAPDQVAAFFLDFESTMVSKPYHAVSSNWVSLPVYFMVSAATWLLLAASALIWLGKTVRWLLSDRSSLEIPQLLLWSFYGAFAAIGVLTIILDMSGFLSGNLQIRAFPAFAMLAAPLLAIWLINLIEKQSLFGRTTLPVLWLALIILAILSVLKATNEPLVSNKWTFHAPDEHKALDWADSQLAGRPVWSGFDERLETTRILLAGRNISQDLDASAVDPGVRDLIFSEVIQSRGQRLERVLPIEPDSFITYDNGNSQLIHLRPRTPFQR